MITRSRSQSPPTKTVPTTVPNAPKKPKNPNPHVHETPIDPERPEYPVCELNFDN
jgi:hypothetical protein